MPPTDDEETTTFPLEGSDSVGQGNAKMTKIVSISNKFLE